MAVTARRPPAKLFSCCGATAPSPVLYQALGEGVTQDVKTRKVSQAGPGPGGAKGEPSVPLRGYHVSGLAEGASERPEKLDEELTWRWETCLEGWAEAEIRRLGNVPGKGSV